MSKSRSIIFIFVLLIGIVSIGLMSTLTSAVTGPIKIMPCGDSVTAGIGSTGNGSYRTDLYKYYTNAGLSIDFVGSQTGGPSTLPDKNHEGHSGWTIPQIANNVNNWLNTYNPDVMLLMIGGNDTLQGTVPTSGLSSLIDQITNLKPNLILFVADYYYSLPSNQNYNLIVQYDAAIPGIVQQKYNAGKKVYFVKLSDAQFSTSEYADGLHPTDSGYSKLATIWYNSTNSILRSLVTSGTPTPTRINTPTPTRRVTPTPTRRGVVNTPTPTQRVITNTPTRGNTPTSRPTSTQAPSPTPPPGGYVVSYVIQSDWGNGATISVTITNKSTTSVNGWTLAFTFPGNQTITNLWNGTYTQSGTSVSVKDAGFNASITANGGSTNLGFNINYSGTNGKPASFTLNGSPCQVQ